MSLSAITSTDYTSGLENESTITLQTATEISSSQFYDSIKPLPLVHTVEIFEDDTITVPNVEEVTVVAPSEDDTVDKVDGPLRLSDIVTSVREPTSGAKKLRKMIFETEELIVCPGVYDGLSARTAMELGFNAMYMVRDMDLI